MDGMAYGFWDMSSIFVSGSNGGGGGSVYRVSLLYSESTQCWNSFNLIVYTMYIRKNKKILEETCDNTCLHHT